MGLQEVLDLQLAVQMRDDHLAECQRQSELDQQQIDELERQVLMQVCMHTPCLPNLKGHAQSFVYMCVVGVYFSEEGCACGHLSVSLFRVCCACVNTRS